MILLGDHNSKEGLVPSETPEIVIAGSGEFSSRRLPQLLGRPTTGEGPETSRSQRRVQERGHWKGCYYWLIRAGNQTLDIKYPQSPPPRSQPRMQL